MPDQYRRFKWLCNQEGQTRRNYSMSRVLCRLVCMVWLSLFGFERPKKEPPAMVAEGSRKTARLVQEPHHTRDSISRSSSRPPHNPPCTSQACHWCLFGPFLLAFSSYIRDVNKRLVALIPRASDALHTALFKND